MADLTTSDLAEWEISFPAHGDTVIGPITAAYATTDANLPGWTLLKDHRHKIVAMVRDAAHPAIRRVTPPAS